MNKNKAIQIVMVIALTISCSFYSSSYEIITPNSNRNWDSEKLGKIMWMNVLRDDGEYMKPLPNDTNKFLFTYFLYHENGCLKIEIQVDTLKKETDYQIKTVCYDEQCDTFWREKIEVEVIDNSEIIINSPIDINVEIHKAFRTDDSKAIKFLVTNDKKSYKVDLKNDIFYVIVFYNSKDEIVNINKIRSLSK